MGFDKEFPRKRKVIVVQEKKCEEKAIEESNKKPIIEINLLLYDFLLLVPKYAKYLKEMFSRKKRRQRIKVKLGEIEAKAEKTEATDTKEDDLWPTVGQPTAREKTTKGNENSRNWSENNKNKVDDTKEGDLLPVVGQPTARGRSWNRLPLLSAVGPDDTSLDWNRTLLRIVGLDLPYALNLLQEHSELKEEEQSRATNFRCPPEMKTMKGNENRRKQRNGAVGSETANLPVGSVTQRALANRDLPQTVGLALPSVFKVFCNLVSWIQELKTLIQDFDLQLGDSKDELLNSSANKIEVFISKIFQKNSVLLAKNLIQNMQRRKRTLRRNTKMIKKLKIFLKM
ncbi:hypothetical protein M9H77_34880 [Catharanthus roseus]|uniref:Uncharacterized protein n=1 Tax=Catharanthus roseus TaxID=4058 RepID=A0ACB9ZMP5_CATRO|nr:hypothetical protein M9H77_34880 [Catharanthus roseus]